MAGGIDWFRWHHGSVTDPKFGLVAKKAGARLGDVLAVWAFALESASSNDPRGVIGPIDAEALEFLLGIEEGGVQRILDAMTQRGLLGAGGDVVSWEKRQPKRERDDDKSTDRVRAFRQKQHQEQPGNAMKRQETPREEESREEVIPPKPPKGGCTAVSLKTWAEERKAAGEVLIPENDPVFVYAAEVGIPDEFMALAWVEFKHRYSQPGAKKYKDWRAVFRRAVRGNWLRLWLCDGDTYRLTTVGQQAQRARGAA